MADFVAVKTVKGASQMGLSMAVPIVMVHTASGSMAAGDKLTFSVMKPDGTKLIAAFASVNMATAVSDVTLKNVKADNTASTIEVILGTAVAQNDTISVVGYISV